MEEKCQNCEKELGDSFLSHCSTKCQFEDYIKSQSVKRYSIETLTDPNLV